MKLGTYKIEVLNKMPRPPAYLSEVMACSVSHDDLSITIDEHSDCVMKLREKYRALNMGSHYPRVDDSYRVLNSVKIPDWWEDNRNLFSTILNAKSIQSVNITGSAIYGDLPDHDVDFSIRINDWESFYSNEEDIRKSLPNNIYGIKTEYFYHGMKYGMFAELDCETKTLYAPSNFAIEGRLIESSIKVVRLDDKIEVDTALRVSKDKCKTCRRV